MMSSMMERPKGTHLRLFTDFQLPLISCNGNQAKGTNLPCLVGGEKAMWHDPYYAGSCKGHTAAAALTRLVKKRATIYNSCTQPIRHHLNHNRWDIRVGALVNPSSLSNFNPFLCAQVAVLPPCAVKGCAGREHAARSPTQRSWAAIVR